MDKKEVLEIENVSSWRKDQVHITGVLTKLNQYYGTTPNASGLEYLQRYDAELLVVQDRLYASTKLKLARIRTDAELWMQNIYKSKWMQAEDYLTKIINYTTYIYTL